MMERKAIEPRMSGIARQSREVRNGLRSFIPAVGLAIINYVEKMDGFILFAEIDGNIFNDEALFCACALFKKAKSTKQKEMDNERRREGRLAKCKRMNDGQM